MKTHCLMRPMPPCPMSLTHADSPALPVLQCLQNWPHNQVDAGNQNTIPRQRQRQGDDAAPKECDAQQKPSKQLCPHWRVQSSRLSSAVSNLSPQNNLKTNIEPLQPTWYNCERLACVMQHQHCLHKHHDGVLRCCLAPGRLVTHRLRVFGA